MAIMNSRRHPSPLAVIVGDMSFFRPGIRAACADFDPEAWFSQSQRPQQAIDICRVCPLLDGCAEWAIEHEKDGVWGGLTENERTRIRKQREKAIA